MAKTVRRKRTTRRKNTLPKLRLITYKNKKHKYKLSDPQKKRILAIEEGINREKNKSKKSRREAAVAKKARFNVLRIYRKNKKPEECRKLTKDMRYIDKKYGLGETKDICKGQQGGKDLPIKKNINNKPLKVCSKNPMTGYYRNGYCMTGLEDKGTHTVCALMDKKFLEYTKSKGNDLYSVVKPGDKWCLCENRWNEAYLDNVAPKVIQSATNMRTKNKIIKNIKTKKNYKKSGGGIGFSKCNPRNHPGLCDPNYMTQSPSKPNYMEQLPRDIVKDIILKIMDERDIENDIIQIDNELNTLKGDIKIINLLISDDDDDIDSLLYELDVLRNKKSMLENEKRELENEIREMDTLVKSLHRGGKNTFLYNPDDPSKSFDVYIDKDPSDTIPIKYKTVKDVKNTIRKLERLYKKGEYPHKRIWQVGMIMYVRLKVLKDKKPKEFKLSEKYFKHLGKRTKIKGEVARKKFSFKM